MIFFKILGFILIGFLCVELVCKIIDHTWNFWVTLKKYNNPERYNIREGSYYRMPEFFGEPMKYRVIIKKINHKKKRITYDVIYENQNDSILNQFNQESSLWDFISLYIMKEAVRQRNNDISDIY